MLQNSCAEKSAMTPTRDDTAGSASLAGLLNGEINFPLGLLGFPASRRFILKRFEPGDGSVSPFLILDSLDEELSFPVIPAHYIAADYAVPVFPELLHSLGAQCESELLPLLIVTVRDRLENSTVNLQGPLLISAGSRVAMQLVVEELPLRQPLVLPATP